MQVSKKEGRVLRDAITRWRESGVLSDEESRKLSASYEVIPFDWKRVARYAFWLAIACILISLSAALADQWLVQLFQELFTAPESAKCLGFAAIAAGLYYWGVTRKVSQPGKVYSNKAIFFAILALSFWYLGSRAERIWQLSLVRNLKR